MVAAFFRLVVLAFLVYVAFLFVRIYLGLKRTRMRRQASPQGRGVMVRDEFCGTYIPREDALTEVRNGAEKYFCCEECRLKSRTP